MKNIRIFYLKIFLFFGVKFLERKKGEFSDKKFWYLGLVNRSDHLRIWCSLTRIFVFCFIHIHVSGFRRKKKHVAPSEFLIRAPSPLDKWQLIHILSYIRATCENYIGMFSWWSNCNFIMFQPFRSARAANKSCPVYQSAHHSQDLPCANKAGPNQPKPLHLIVGK